VKRLPFIIFALAVAPLLLHAASCEIPPSVPMTLALADARMDACNREVRAARLAIDTAHADLRIAAQRPNPNLTLGASNVNPHAGLGSGPLPNKTFDSSVRLDQLIERGDKARWRRAQAEAALAAARAEAKEVLRQQRLQTRAAFFDLAAAQDKARVQEEFVGISEAAMGAAGKRLGAGDVSAAEANRFRLDAARASADLAQARAERQRARLELAKLLGAEPWSARLEVSLPDQWPTPVDKLARGDRPDVAATRYRLEAAEAAFQLARSLATRDVTVGLQADRWPVSESNTQGTGVSYSLSVQIPLHWRHANEGEAARAYAERENARAAMLRAESLARGDAESAEADWQLAQERRRRLESEVRPLAIEVSRAAEYSYSKGATGVLDLLEARRSLKAVELEDAQAVADMGRAWARRAAAVESIDE
jgi:cobalt-zinc-cadmium efflux system outer membrane protein